MGASWVVAQGTTQLFGRRERLCLRRAIATGWLDLPQVMQARHQESAATPLQASSGGDTARRDTLPKPR
jgi:hypothetical protein